MPRHCVCCSILRCTAPPTSNTYEPIRHVGRCQWCLNNKPQTNRERDTPTSPFAHTRYRYSTIAGTATAAACSAAMTLPATSVARAATKYVKMSDNEDAHTDTVGANEGKGWLDAATFSWLTPLLRFGKTTPLELKHLPALPPKHSSQRWVQAFEAAWAAAKAPRTAPSGGDAGSKDRVTAQGYRVISAMVAMFRLEIVIITLMTLSTQSCMFARVFVLRALITHLQDGPAAGPEGEDDVGGYLAWGILLAILLAACDMGTTSIWYHLYQREEMFAMHVRVLRSAFVREGSVLYVQPV